MNIRTHHAPSIQSIKHVDNLTKFFYSNMENEILEYQPDIWIHGHTHMGSMYKIDKTLVVCNPKGYPSERTIDRQFNPYLVVDI